MSKNGWILQKLWLFEVKLVDMLQFLVLLIAVIIFVYITPGSNEIVVFNIRFKGENKNKDFSNLKQQNPTSSSFAMVL